MARRSGKALTSQAGDGKGAHAPAAAPTRAQRRYLKRGLDQPGGKLPLFDEYGQEISHRTIRSCIDAGWAKPWFANPVKPDWLVCKLTEKGRSAVTPARKRGRAGPVPASDGRVKSQTGAKEGL